MTKIPFNIPHGEVILDEWGIPHHSAEAVCLAPSVQPDCTVNGRTNLTGVVKSLWAIMDGTTFLRHDWRNEVC